MTDDTLIGHELLLQVVGLEPKVVETKSAPTTADDIQMKITFTIEEEDVETSAFGLIFALGVLSFHDARPRGVSGMHFEEADQWEVSDMLKYLRFERGELHFYADYVRGRMMKTTVDVRRDGTILLETVNRGRSAERWVRTLQGKKRLEVVGGDVSLSDEPDPEEYPLLRLALVDGGEKLPDVDLESLDEPGDRDERRVVLAALDALVEPQRHVALMRRLFLGPRLRSPEPTNVGGEPLLEVQVHGILVQPRSIGLSPPLAHREGNGRPSTHYRPRS